MAAINDVYKVTSLGFRGPTAIRNVFFYKALTTGAVASDLASGFKVDVLDPLLQCQADHFALESVAVENLNSPTDFTFYQLPTPEAGKRGSPYAADVLAIAMIAPSKLKGIRPGNKRIGPLALSMVNANTVTGNSTELARLTTLAAALSADVTGSSVDPVYRPIIIKRTYLGIVNGNRRYSVPAVATSTNHFVADNWGFKQILTTQITRKPGRGE
jgi:hypothetical protein